MNYLKKYRNFSKSNSKLVFAKYLLISMLFGCIAACGQKGNLYLETSKKIDDKQISFIPKTTTLTISEPGVLHINLPEIKGYNKILPANAVADWEHLIKASNNLKYVVFIDGLATPVPYDLFIGDFANTDKDAKKYPITVGDYLRFTNNGDIKQLPEYLQKVKNYLATQKQYEVDNKVAFMSIEKNRTILYVKLR